MSLNHDTLVEMIGELNYPIGIEGMCYGFAVMGMQAALLNDFQSFSKRLEFLQKKLDKVSVDTFIKEIKQIEKNQVDSLELLRKNLLEQLALDSKLSDNAFYKLLEERQNDPQVI